MQNNAKMSSSEPITNSQQNSPGKAGWAARLSQKLKRSSVEDTEHSNIAHDTLSRHSVPSTIGNSQDSAVPPSLDSDFSSGYGKTVKQDTAQMSGRNSYEKGQAAVIPPKSEARKNEDTFSQGNITTSHTHSPAIRRKDVPSHGNRTGSVDLTHEDGTVTQHTTHNSAVGVALGSPGTDLPIAAKFTDHRSERDTRSSLDAARDILNRQDAGAQTNPRTRSAVPVDELTKDVEGLGLSSSEVRSPASFVSANDDYFEIQPEMQSKRLPSAEEIVERAKHSSVDTVYHNKTAPAVTHETIKKQIHEITEKRITRDIHHYHHVHRILPVHEVEILPAKHYRIVDGVQVEMKPEEVPQSRIDAWESAIIPKIED